MTAKYFAHNPERNQRARAKAYGKRVHEALHILEGGAQIAEAVGLTHDEAFRVGLSGAFAHLGFSNEEIADAIKKITRNADAKA